MEMTPATFSANDMESTQGFSEELIERWGKLSEAMERLSGADSLDALIETLRSTARGIVKADGIAIVLKDREFCHYVAEDAQAPLWAGQRFPAVHCVSGWAMREGMSVSIPDVFDDARVPVDAYKVTFVRSMAMIPIGKPNAFAAVGAYWASVRKPADHEIAMLEMLARAAATALENARLINSLERRVAERTAELEKTHEQLRHTQKMEVIGQLTGNVAHDFNNLLTPIFASLDVLRYRGDKDERTQRNIARATEAAERARVLVQRLLAFARRQPLLPRGTDLDHLLAGMQHLIESTLGPRIVLFTNVQRPLPPIWADANQLELAILNLAVNARDAMPEGGAVTLSATPLTADMARPKDLPPGDYVRLTVKDDGVGMDKDVAARAIEPFFSTKRLGQGTGLGLSMAHGLVAQLGGTMEIESKVGFGTTIALYIPVATADEMVQVTQDDETPEVKADRGLALIIDDDALVRSGTSEMLSDLGFEVIEAETAHDGLDMIHKGLEPRIVITDHMMPGMTGTELARNRVRSAPSYPFC